MKSVLELLDAVGGFLRIFVYPFGKGEWGHQNSPRGSTLGMVYLEAIFGSSITKECDMDSLSR